MMKFFGGLGMELLEKWWWELAKRLQRVYCKGGMAGRLDRSG